MVNVIFSLGFLIVSLLAGLERAIHPWITRSKDARYGWRTNAWILVSFTFFSALPFLVRDGLQIYGGMSHEDATWIAIPFGVQFLVFLRNALVHRAGHTPYVWSSEERPGWLELYRAKHDRHHSEGGHYYIPWQVQLYLFAQDLVIVGIVTWRLCQVNGIEIGSAYGESILIGLISGCLVFEFGHAWAHTIWLQFRILWGWIFRTGGHDLHHEKQAGYWGVYHATMAMDLLSDKVAKILVWIMSFPERLFGLRPYFLAQAKEAREASRQALRTARHTA